MFRLIGILCFGLPGVLAVGAAIVFVFQRDWLWKIAHRMEGMIPEDQERLPDWDRQMILVGLMIGAIGVLCLSFTIIGLAFSD